MYGSHSTYFVKEEIIEISHLTSIDEGPFDVKRLSFRILCVGREWVISQVIRVRTIITLLFQLLSKLLLEAAQEM